VHRRVSSEPRALPRALQNVERALRAGRPHWLVVRVSRPSVRAGQAAPREPGREGRCRPGPRADFGPVAREFKNSFSIFHSVSN
jgi:hypothetical protein